MAIAAELTDAEARIAQLLGQVWNEYLLLPKEHPMEQQEFCTAIHACQDMVLSRAGRRAINANTDHVLTLVGKPAPERFKGSHLVPPPTVEYVRKRNG